MSNRQLHRQQNTGQTRSAKYQEKYNEISCEDGFFQSFSNEQQLHDNKDSQQYIELNTKAIALIAKIIMSCNALTGRTKEILDLRCFKEMTEQEAASSLGINQSTINKTCQAINRPNLAKELMKSAELRQIIIELIAMEDESWT
jgi:DNA-directed RNA polymerase specialized sigma subunit